METKKINVIVKYWQSNKHPSDWGLRFEMKDGYRDILPVPFDLVNKSTRFGENASLGLIEEVSKAIASQIIEGFGCEMGLFTFQKK